MILHTILLKNTGGNNFLWVHVNKYNLNIGLVYRPGDTDDKAFLEAYGKQLQNKKRAIVFGDFNLDILRTSPSIRSYKEILNEVGFLVLNKINIEYSTRESATRKSIIDHICTNITNNKFHLAVIESTMSDHKQLYLEVEKKEKLNRKRVSYKAIDYKKLCETLKHKKPENLLNNYSELEQWIKTSMNESTTTKTKILNPPQEDWINKEIVDGINARNLTYQKFKKDATNEKLANKLNIEKNKVSATIKTSKCKYYTNCFNNCKKQPKKMWQLINKLSKNKIKNSSTPPKLMDQSGTVLTDKNDICEHFNDFFSSVGTTSQ